MNEKRTNARVNETETTEENNQKRECEIKTKGKHDACAKKKQDHGKMLLKQCSDWSEENGEVFSLSGRHVLCECI